MFQVVEIYRFTKFSGQENADRGSTFGRTVDQFLQGVSMAYGGIINIILI
jgi:hypothetical protein